MAKRILSPRIKDQVCSQDYHAKRHAAEPDSKALYGDRHPIRPTRKISYISGESLRSEPPTTPRLFIRGLIGGSLKIDLLGIGIGLSSSAFSQWISDESLASIHVHRGDLAILDPVRNLKHLDVVLVLQEGREVFRRLVKNRGIWLLRNLDGRNSPAVPLIDQPMQGVVVGFLRLCVATKAVNYALEDRDFETPEHKGVGPRFRDEKTPTSLHRQRTRDARSESCAVILTSEQSAPQYLSSKVKKGRGQIARAKIR